MAFADHRHCSSSTSGSRRVSELSERGEGAVRGEHREHAFPAYSNSGHPRQRCPRACGSYIAPNMLWAISWSAAQCDKSVLLPVLGGGSDDERLLSVASLIPQGERISGLSF
jgi:hypothetical protein